MEYELAGQDNENCESRIPVAAPVLDGLEAAYVRECMETGWISSHGRFVVEFERAFAKYCGVRHAIAVNNGTAALHLSLVSLGVGPGDEVIVPTLTYIATANAVRYCNATPVFADCEAGTFNLDPADVARKITSRTKGVIPVHLYGHPVNMDAIRELAGTGFIVEDAAEAIGAKYMGRPVGSLATCAAFSFFGNKIITTGEGGMVTTDDDDLAKRLRLFRGQGMDPDRRYWFPVVGYNYRMTNIAAAIGLAQLQRIDHHLATRRAIAASYDRRLSMLSDLLVLPASEDWAEHSHWLYTVQLGDRVAKDRDQVMQELDRAGIETRPVFHPMHVLPPYRDVAVGAFPSADRCSARGISLPTHGRLTERDIERICDALERALR